ncbi:hypothetical protein V0288_24830 [Pannus brasiliensis CCIBt3594]|uniref:Uncharacterized protein n=1 Tax=Pannus brasiliensis CCIBt3594 TaxID=1427578 RepID=A0AAW9R1J0_9CHRO
MSTNEITSLSYPDDVRCPNCGSVRLAYRGQYFYGDDQDPEDGYAGFACESCGHIFDTSELEDQPKK